MPEVKTLKSQLAEDGVINATMNNIVLSPVDASGKNQYMFTLNSYFPQKVMIYSYGLNVTISVDFNNLNKPTFYEMSPGTGQTIQIPAGTTQFYAESTKVEVINPNMAYIATTFD